AAEQWPLIGQKVFDLVRAEVRGKVDQDPPDQPFIFGSDLSDTAVATANLNAQRAGVASMVRFRQADVHDLKASALPKMTGFERHLVVCNPPYGERLLDPQKAEQLYRGLSKAFLEQGKARPGIRFFVITPYDQFESLAGGSADKRRKLYNGMIKCTLFQYFKKRSKDK
ncbi:MAG: class I SAM-dependent RNA methyltransferase, partial [Bacillota bacterium]|nr:class I SAM-dependent RNA methyltransferase [Bacillota bacterium]